MKQLHIDTILSCAAIVNNVRAASEMINGQLKILSEVLPEISDETMADIIYHQKSLTEAMIEAGYEVPSDGKLVQRLLEFEDGVSSGTEEEVGEIEQSQG